MTFWTSKEPGVLPKWVFWLFAIWAPIDFILTIEEAAATGRQPMAGGTAMLAICAWCAHKNYAKTLVWINAVGAIVAFGCALLWRSALPQQLSRTGFDDWSTGLFLISGVISTLFAVYLNKFSAKDTDHDSSPSDLSSPVSTTHSESLSNAELVSTDDYANELTLFEAGDWDQSLWAKHLVEAEGDAEKAKWRYIKERVVSAPARRRAIDEKLDSQQRAVEHLAVEKLEEAKKRARKRRQQERDTESHQRHSNETRGTDDTVSPFWFLFAAVPIIVIILISSQS